MTHEEAKSVKHLAAPVMKVLEGLDMECPKCRGHGYDTVESPDDLTIKKKTWIEHPLKCLICNGTGRIKHSWTPKVGETVYYRLAKGWEVFQIISVGDTRLILLPFNVPYKFHTLDDFIYAPEIIDVTPILDWGEIRKALKSYYLTFTSGKSGGRITIYKGVGTDKKYEKYHNNNLQEAIMLAVIELGKELNRKNEKDNQTHNTDENIP